MAWKSYSEGMAAYTLIQGSSGTAEHLIKEQTHETGRLRTRGGWGGWLGCGAEDCGNFRGRRLLFILCPNPGPE